MGGKPPGLFVTGTGTGVGKTYVACLIARTIAASGKRVGVYKPVESGVERTDGSDSQLLAAAAGRAGEEGRTCPQQFRAPLAPHLAAAGEDRQVDEDLLRSGIYYWQQRSDFVLIEGAGGLMSPLSPNEYVADLAIDLGYPLLVVAPNTLGVINQTLQTLIAASTFRDGLEVAGIVLNDLGSSGDISVDSNRKELEARCVPPVVAQLAHGTDRFDADVDWLGLAAGGDDPSET